jgi:uncharacterized protein YkwD
MQFLHPKLLAISLLLALLQACGGGGGDDTNSSDATAAAPATSTATPTATPTAPAPAASSPTGSAPSPDTTCGLANFEVDALRLVNQQRAAGATCGSRGSFAPTAALTWNARLVSAAYGHSRDMADNNYFSHDSLDGRTMVDRINATGYTWSTIGENIAAGYSSVQSTVNGWMASEGHCANLMNPRFTELGMACARNDASQYRIYWTQNLGRP